MNEDERACGKYIEARRKSLGITLRGLAATLSIAPAYMSDIEKGRRYPPEKKLYEISEALQLNEDETNHLLDLAAVTKDNTVSADLPKYIMEKDLARVALRRAKAGKLSDDGWREVIDLIDKRVQE